MDTQTLSSPDERPSPIDLSHRFSKITKRRGPMFLTDYYGLIAVPGMRNIAGGFPNPLLFPFDTLEAHAAYPGRWTSSVSVLHEPAAVSLCSSSKGANHIVIPRAVDEKAPSKRIDLTTALQYGAADGYPALLSWVRHFSRKNLHPSVPYHGGPEVAMTSGSTDGFSKVLQIFIDPWDENKDSICDRPALLAEAYTYPAVLTETVARGVQTVLVKADDAGMIVSGPGGLEDILSNWDHKQGRRPHLMYTVAQAHNPTGYVVPLPRKKEIYAVCQRYDVVIIEDEAYWYLQFPSAAADEARSRGLPVPPPTPPHQPAISSGYPFIDSKIPSFLSMDTDGRVIRLDTFSKIIAPGCRLGWITAQPDIIERYLRTTATSTQQPSGFTQGLVAQLLLGPPSPPPPTTTKPTTTRFPFPFRLPFSTPPPTPAPSPSPIGWSTSGFVTWLTGLHTVYHRRMTTMCRILDAGSHLPAPTPTPGDDECAGWTSVATVPLLTFRWPAGGMFVWVRVRFENHPLFGRTTGARLSRALYMLLTDAPFRVAVGCGTMFSATDAVRDEDGWAFFRLCFAAETEENVESASRGFVDGVHMFWGLGMEEVEGLLGRYPEGTVTGGMGVGWVGC